MTEWLNKQINFVKHVCMYMVSHVPLFAIPWTVDCQVPLSIEFSRQEYWSVLPFPTPGDLPYPRSNSHLLTLLHWRADSLPLHRLGSPRSVCTITLVMVHYEDELQCVNYPVPSDWVVSSDHMRKWSWCLPQTSQSSPFQRIAGHFNVSTSGAVCLYCPCFQWANVNTAFQHCLQNLLRVMMNVHTFPLLGTLASREKGKHNLQNIVE